jgi:hypothetical protein
MQDPGLVTENAVCNVRDPRLGGFCPVNVAAQLAAR